MLQIWLVRQLRQVADKLFGNNLLLTGQRVQHGTTAIAVTFIRKVRQKSGMDRSDKCLFGCYGGR
jgi:hypothetical protein